MTNDPLYLRRSLTSWLSGLTDLPADACWPLPNTMRDKRQRTRGRTINTFRYLYEVFIGPLPPDQSLRRRCRSTDCCNPFHAITFRHTGAHRFTTLRRKGSAAAIMATALDLTENIEDYLTNWNDFPPAPKTLPVLLHRLHMGGHPNLTEDKLLAELAKRPDLKGQLHG